jgi:antimicrobial peptide system SdpB family protein
LSALTAWVVLHAVAFDPRDKALALGRSLLAAAQLLVFLANPVTALFHGDPRTPGGVRCEDFRAAASWCLTGTTGAGGSVSLVLALVVLGAVVTGFSPRWTCVPHWYVVFSFVAASPTANGGDRIGQITTMLLVPLCLGDDRTWHWVRPRAAMAPGWRGSAFAALWVLRLQVFVVYAHAVVSKLNDHWWRHGGALLLVAHDPEFGFPRGVRELLDDVAGAYWPVALLSWPVVAAQAVVAVFVLSMSAKARLLALVLGIALHVAIAVFMSLVVFGMIMIALLVFVCVVEPLAGRARGREVGTS